jgi:pyruvate dehydrogenase E2 component (dihydrolipoamide acetyltransferase)
MGVFKMPSLGADMEAGTLVEWLVKPGDTVKRGDIVAAVETQKGVIEIEVFEAGTVHHLIADQGAELPVGAPLALILAEGEAPPETAAEREPEPAPQPVVEAVAAEPALVGAGAPAPQPAAPGPASARPMPPTQPALAGPTASPAARVRAHELGLDLSQVKGSGPGGVIVLGDVEGAQAAPARASLTSKEMPKGSPLEEMRKAIAAAMTRSKQTIPHFYLSETIDVQPAMDMLTALNAHRQPAQRVLLGALFVRAAARAAAKVKVMNGHYTNHGFQPASVVNPGVAVALRGGGLVAPAIMDVLSLDLDATMAAMRELVTRARAGRLRGSEMTEGTITVSSLGETGAEAMTGVIFPPQVALVGIGAPHVRPWVVDGAVIPRSVVTLTLSADHRVSDGRQAARFITEFETLLQTPETL